jgi:hypothetical protein
MWSFCVFRVALFQIVIDRTGLRKVGIFGTARREARLAGFEKSRDDSANFRGTLVLPGETEAGSAEEHPAEG